MLFLCPSNFAFQKNLAYDKPMSGENLNKEAVVETQRRKWDVMQNHLDECGRRIGAVAQGQV
jgi:hypothetical protein